MKGILGKKIGMTQVFTNKGDVIPVTIIKIDNNTVIQVKTKEKDGYDAVKLGFEEKAKRLTINSEIGIFNKIKTTPKRYVKEIRNFEREVKTGDIITPTDLFEEGEFLNITGTSKGKGFQGAIKRHNQSRGPMSHGSRYHRRPGSMGAITANRVFKGKKLPGHMGNRTITAQNLVLIKIDKENNVILVKGNVPGTKKSLLIIKSNNRNIKKRENKELWKVNKTAN